VIDSDARAARAIGRPRVHRPYLGLVNYTNNLRRLGWTDGDLQGEGSDALIDALVARGDPDQVAAQLREFLDAGADHVCVQLLHAEVDTDPLPGYQQLAAALELG
jgi:probable F420-dependent oxidoreductase